MYYFRIQKLQREPLDQGNLLRLIMSLIFPHRRNYELARKGSAIYTDACGDTEGHWEVLERSTLDHSGWGVLPSLFRRSSNFSSLSGSFDMPTFRGRA